jgi:DNA-binding NarL/FixJ family response regulator
VAPSPRQQQILTRIAEGLSDKEISVQLGISRRTVEAHLQQLYQRYGIHKRSALVAAWLRNMEGVGWSSANR